MRIPQAYLALMLLLHLMPRRQDPVKLGRKNLIERDDGVAIRFKPQQPGNATSVELPVHTDLIEAINAMNLEIETFLARNDGHPCTPETLTNYIPEWRQEAGTTTKVPEHGTRHTSGIDVAENEASEYEIMATLCHTCPKTTARYTKEARRRKQAKNGAKKSKPCDRVAGFIDRSADHPK